MNLLKYIRAFFVSPGVRVNFPLYVSTEVAKLLVESVRGFPMFLIVSFLCAVLMWNILWFLQRMNYYVRHPERDTFEEFRKNFAPTALRTIEMLVLVNFLFDVADLVVSDSGSQGVG